ncbi:hypothetical protein BGZ83_006290 [Gryganskiella cystojenkinii]|nr:hypothetical protein BGZ83_006290 [Gryganskiella cystojenkinii]
MSLGSVPSFLYPTQPGLFTINKLVRHLRLDECFPLEIWDKISYRLYPSQLSRLLMVNKKLVVLINSLKIWRQMFFLAYGPEKVLRFLHKIPESNSYMLYLRAIRSHLCEECFSVAQFQQSHQALLPLPVLAHLPKLIIRTREGKIVDQIGEEVNASWVVHKCLPCRQKHYAIQVDSDVDSLPSSFRGLAHSGGSKSWTEWVRSYPKAKAVPALAGFRYNRDAILQASDFFRPLSQHFGGDIGIEFSNKSTHDRDTITRDRIFLYRTSE